jgi:hypothetical protein
MVIELSVTEIVGLLVAPLLGAEAVPRYPLPGILAESRLAQRGVGIIEQGRETAALKMFRFWQSGEIAKRRIQSHELDERLRSFACRLAVRNSYEKRHAGRQLEVRRLSPHPVMYLHRDVTKRVRPAPPAGNTRARKAVPILRTDQCEGCAPPRSHSNPTPVADRRRE